ncbi:MAG TPA: flagellar export chaperone FliS [Terriglobales bacterium]|jgi:flagellar biosynthetic protein FliS|nr:flagellar export chaperone FliS [Terriglobales bacterium]
MIENGTVGSYRSAAVHSASQIGLVVIVYDVLIGDLQRAVAAMQEGDIEGRCTELKHALLALQILEGSLDMDAGAEAATNLSRFYSFVRSGIMEAQFETNPEILSRQIQLLYSVREAWQQAESERLAATAPLATPVAGRESFSATG